MKLQVSLFNYFEQIDKTKKIKRTQNEYKSDAKVPEKIK